MNENLKSTIFKGFMSIIILRLSVYFLKINDLEQPEGIIKAVIVVIIMLCAFLILLQCIFKLIKFLRS